MKYEMFFGDEGLFFDAQQDCEMVGNGHHKVENGKLMVWNFSEKYWAESHTNKITIAAMRRIIKEPKRWTWEDKKAGRLPEVGSDVLFGKKGKHDVKIAEFIGTGTIEYVWCLKLRCGSYVFVESDIVSPIETPAEKAQREENEFVAKHLPRNKPILCGTGFQIYERGFREAYQILSGELPPVQAKDVE